MRQVGQKTTAVAANTWNITHAKRDEIEKSRNTGEAPHIVASQWCLGCRGAVMGQDHSRRQGKANVKSKSRGGRENVNEARACAVHNTASDYLYFCDRVSPCLRFPHFWYT